MILHLNIGTNRREEEAYTLVEVLIAVFILAIMIISLYAGYSAGFSVVQVMRENLRATQILIQRAETIRLYNWTQVTDTNYLKPTFTEKYDPRATTTNTGTLYVGVVTTNVPAGLPAAYNTNMLDVKITLYWTNYTGNRKVVRSRQMETYVARYGLQNYIYGQ